MKVYQRYFLILIYVLLVSSFALSLAGEMSRPMHGDEFYLNGQVELLEQKGLFVSMSEGSPVGYSVVILLLKRLGLSFLMAGRTLALISVIPILLAQFYIAKKILNLRGFLCHLSILFSSSLLVNTGKQMFHATADIFFYSFIIWSIVMIVKMMDGERPFLYAAAAGILLALSFTIRPLTLLYLPGVFLSLVIIALLFTRRRKIIPGGLVLFSIVLSGFVLWQIPSLSEHKAITLENKMESGELNWTQRHYLSRMKNMEGKQRLGYDIIGWDEEKKFLKEHGEEALPKGMLDAVFWDMGFTLRRFANMFFINSAYCHLRLLGAFFPLALIALFRFGIDDSKKNYYLLLLIAFFYSVTYNLIAPFTAWGHLLVVNLIIIGLGSAVLESMQEKNRAYYKIILSFQAAVLFLSICTDLLRSLGIPGNGSWVLTVLPNL